MRPSRRLQSDACEYLYNPSFEGHNQAVVQAPMDQARPVSRRGIGQLQFSPDTFVKRVKNNVDDDYIRVEAIDSG